ncbi:unnamed protein product [Calypogeia fissa]
MKETALKLGTIEGIWEGLVGILAKIEGRWRQGIELRKHAYQCRLEKRAHFAANILRSLALEDDIQGIRPSLYLVEDGLLFLQLVEMARHYDGLMAYSPTQKSFYFQHYSSTRALAVLCANPSAPRSVDFLELRDLFVGHPSDECPTNNATMSSTAVDICYTSLYWTRVQVSTRMKSYNVALKNLDLAHHHLAQIKKVGRQDPFSQMTKSRYEIWFTYLRDCRIYLQAMLKDYKNALLGATKRLDDRKYWCGCAGALAELGVLKRLSGDLQGALEDFNASARASADLSLDRKGCDVFRSQVLKHRGYVKFLMDDKTGAKEDAECAKNLLEPRIDLRQLCDSLDCTYWILRYQHVNYLGFSL